MRLFKGPIEQSMGLFFGVEGRALSRPARGGIQRLSKIPMVAGLGTPFFIPGVAHAGSPFSSNPLPGHPASQAGQHRFRNKTTLEKVDLIYL
jgi:hypothetical protein